MKPLPLPLRLGVNVLLWAVAAIPAFGGRMADTTGPAVFSREEGREPGRVATESPVTEMVDEDDEPAKDSELEAERPEASHDDLPVADIPAAPPPRWKMSRSLSLGVSTDDNVYLSSANKKSDQIITFQGNFQLLWGLKEDDSYLILNYAPSGSLFAKGSAANAFEQKASLAGQWRTAKLTLRAQMGVQTLSGGDVDVGTRANRTLWQTSLQAKYDYSTKTSFEVNLAPNASNYSNYFDSMEWVNSNWIDYQLLPKTRLGAGVTFGYLIPQGGRAQTYQQALVRLNNPLSGKLTLNASGGMEIRQLGATVGTQTTPVFHMGASYQPSERTEISAEASRRTYSSASMVGQDFVTTGGTIRLRQWITSRYLVALTGGYEDAEYKSTTGKTGNSRHDQYFFVRPSVSIDFMKRMQLELYYQYRHNISTTGTSSFASNVAGLQATINF